MEKEIQEFWESRPCGADLVGDLSEKSKQDYEAFFTRLDNFRYQKEPHILKNLDRINFQEKRVLEIGSGIGSDAEQIIRRGGIYTAVDLTEESVERIKMRFSLRNLPFETVERGSALKLPFAENSFDIVFSHGVLHHIPDIQRAQKEIARILKPEGVLIMMLYAKRSLNYLLSISLLRRVGLMTLYFVNPRVGGIYGQHIKQAREKGIWNYLKMNNFININTDGPFNPYSKVYDVSEVKKDFADFYIIEARQDFMHAPPLKINWLPLAKWFGWHLWVTMKKR